MVVTCMIFKKNKIIDFLKTFNKGYKEYRWRILLLIFLGFFGGLLEGIGINLIIPLFAFLTDNNPVGQNFLTSIVQKI